MWEVVMNDKIQLTLKEIRNYEKKRLYTYARRNKMVY